MAIETHIKTALAELMFSNLSAASQIEDMAKQIAALQAQLTEAQEALANPKSAA